MPALRLYNVSEPATPILSIIVDEDEEILLGLNFSGQADSFTFKGI